MVAAVGLKLCARGDPGVLTLEQEAHFRLFGFLVLREAFGPSEVVRITQDFDEVLSEGRAGLPFAGEERQIVMGFIEKRPSLTALVEDDRIYEAVHQLLGGTPVWIGSDGNLYVGETYLAPGCSCLSADGYQGRALPRPGRAGEWLFEGDPGILIWRCLVFPSSPPPSGGRRGGAPWA